MNFNDSLGYYGNESIDEECMMSFRNIHVLINIQKFDLKWIDKMKENYRVHIFVNWFMDPFYGNDKFFEFCEKAERVTKRNIIIHVWKKSKSIKYSVESKLYGFNEYKLVIDNKEVSFNIGLRYGIPFILTIHNEYDKSRRDIADVLKRVSRK